MKNTSYIILHGIGDQHWLHNLGVLPVAHRLGIPVKQTILYDYSKVLDASKFHPVFTRVKFIGGILADVVGFFKDSETKNKIVSGYQKLVKREQDKGNSVVVIAHSLGTVVAVLGAMPNVRIVSLGSPLHWPFVRKIADVDIVARTEFYAGTRDYVACFARKIPGSETVKLRGFNHKVEWYWAYLRGQLR